MSVQVSPEDLMRFLDGEASAEGRERVDRQLANCRSLQEEMVRLRILGSELRTLLPTPVPPQASVWELVREKLQEGTG
ncbi:anti-sigma factor family protein [Gemmatimonadota bacterium]